MLSNEHSQKCYFGSGLNEKDLTYLITENELFKCAKTLNVSGLDNISLDSIWDLINSCKDGLREVNLRDFHRLTEEFLLNIAQKCPQLVNLDFTRTIYPKINPAKKLGKNPKIPKPKLHLQDEHFLKCFQSCGSRLTQLCMAENKFRSSLYILNIISVSTFYPLSNYLVIYFVLFCSKTAPISSSQTYPTSR